MYTKVASDGGIGVEKTTNEVGEQNSTALKLKISAADKLKLGQSQSTGEAHRSSSRDFIASL